jgi:hypothetical protein
MFQLKRPHLMMTKTHPHLLKLQLNLKSSLMSIDEKGPLYTWTKSRYHENLRALENHPNSTPSNIEFQFCKSVVSKA